MEKKSTVHCKIPDAGLGNQLFAIVKAYYFGQINQIPVIASGYNRIKIGPYLRGEKSKRRYHNYFTFQKNWIEQWWERRKLKAYTEAAAVKEPALEIVSSKDTPALYEFSEVPHWSDYFKGLKEHRKEIREVFKSLVQKGIFQEVNRLEAPCIGVHIRMGDFRKLQSGEDFGKSGAVRTPEEYFINMINAIRKINGRDLPVSVFTDGFRHELKNLLDLPNVSIVEGNKDIVDMILLSKSKLIVTSAGSTFSYWAAFLADAPVVRHSEHLHAPIRPSSTNQVFYEGPLQTESVDELLVRNIKDIH